MSSVLYEDRILVTHLTEKYFDAAKKLFTDIWLSHNVLYRSAKVPVEDFALYVDILLQRALIDPKTAAIALDTSQNTPLLVSIGFAKDLYSDPVSSALSRLPSSMEGPIQFNNEALMHFKGNVLFSSFQKPGKIAYFLHGGTRDIYAGQYCAGLSISSRIGEFIIKEFIMLGYQGMVGVGTHPEIIRRMEKDVQKDFNTICLTRKDITSWKLNGKQIFKEALDSPPAFLSFTLFAQPQPSRL